MEFFDFGTIFFFITAVIVFFQLRNVLGRRTGHERPPFDPYTLSNKESKLPPNENSNVVILPKQQEVLAKDFTNIDAIAPVGTALNEGLRTIQDADASFVPQNFLNGVKIAYEMIVTSFAKGEGKTLKDLLSKDVYDDFMAAIAERESRGEKNNVSFVGIHKIAIVSTVMKENEAHITVRIVSQLISTTLDREDKIIDGDPETVSEVKDVWTFARDTRSSDPNWKLVMTQVDDN